MVVLNEDNAPEPTGTSSSYSVNIQVHDGPSSPRIYLKAESTEQLKQDLVAVFGNVEIEDLASASVIDVIALAHASARQIYQLNEILGATVDAKKPSQFESKGSGWGNRGGGSKPSPETESVGRREKPADPNQGVLDAINGASSQAEVLTIFTRHSTGDMKTNSGWPTAEQAAAAKAKFAEFNKKKEQG